VNEDMRFGQALDELLCGNKIARRGWNGQKQHHRWYIGSVFQVNRPPLLGIYPDGTEITYRPHIDMKTVDGSCVPWVASQTDILADDWYVVR